MGAWCTGIVGEIMNNQFFEQPVLNSPYGYPSRHWELDETGQPTQRIIEGRRLPSSFGGQVMIYAAYPNEPWPGKVAVVTNRVHVRKGEWRNAATLPGGRSTSSQHSCRSKKMGRQKD